MVNDPSTAVVNEAIQLIGNNQPPVTGVAPTFDNSTAGIAASYLYQPSINAVGRQFGWDFNRNTKVLSLSGNVPPVPWRYEYIYPSDGLQIRQLLRFYEEDFNNPIPLDWSVANDVVGGSQVRVILAHEPNLLAVYSNMPGPQAWDSIFREAVVRLLASTMAMAVAGKPDAAMAMVEQYAQFGNMGEQVDS